MRLVLASALTLVPTVALAHSGHGEPGPLHGLGHAAGSAENLLALGIVAVIVAGGAVLAAVLARRGTNQR